MLTEGEQRKCPVLLRQVPHLLETGALSQYIRVIREVRERLAGPQRKQRLQRLHVDEHLLAGGPGGVGARGQLAGQGRQLAMGPTHLGAEAGGIHIVAGDVEQVAVVSGHEHARLRPWREGRLQGAPQMRDVGVQRAMRRRWRVAAPDEFREAVCRDHPSRGQREGGEHAAAFAGAEVHVAVGSDHVGPTQNAYLHGRHDNVLGPPVHKRNASAWRDAEAMSTLITHSSSTSSTTPTTSPLALAVAALVVTDLAGGLITVGTGLNSWFEAWGSRALLAAPWPMIAAQVLLCWLALRWPGRRAAVAAGLLAVACLVSVVSGFFDGGLRHAGLTGGTHAFQILLLAVTGVVGVMAAFRAAQCWRRPGSSRPVS